MMKKLKIGLVKIKAESGENRDFLPSFIEMLLKLGIRFFLKRVTEGGWVSKKKIISLWLLMLGLYLANWLFSRIMCLCSDILEMKSFGECAPVFV